MDNFTLNKWAGAVLASCIILFVLVEISRFLFHKETLTSRGYQIEVPEVKPEGEIKEVIPFSTFLAVASAERGKRVASKCLGCHSFNEGEPHKTGPNLYGVIGNDVARLSDYAYSSVITEHEGAWTVSQLNLFLQNPKSYIKGTKMGYIGLKKDQQRADIISYLNTLTPSPVELVTE